MKGCNSVVLAEIAEIFNGKTPSKSEQRSHGHPVLKIKDVSDLGEFRGNFESFIDPDLAEVYAGKCLREGDTLILNAAHNANYVGSKTYRVQHRTAGALATGEWLVIRPVQSQLDSGFTFHWVNSARTRRLIRDMVKGIHLYPKDVARLPISVPPLPEQRRIADVLDRVERLRAKRRAALGQLELLTQSLFVDLYRECASRCPSIPLADIADATRGAFVNGPFGSNLLTHELQKEGVPVIYIRDIRDGEYNRVSKSYVTERKARGLALCSVRPGDVLVAKVGDPPGIAAVYPEGEADGIVTQDVIRIRVSPEVAIPQFVVGYLNSSIGRWKVSTITIKATRARFSLTDFKELKIEIPPVQQQYEFGRRVAAVEKLRAAQRASLAAMDELFTSLQYRAFQGLL